MAVKLSNGVRKLFEAPNFGHIATINPDGSPQVTVVWVDIDGDRILVNTADGRIKPKNVRRDPRVTVSIVDQNNAYAWAAVSGRVVELTPEGGDEHIDRLAKKYLGQDKYPLRREGEVRLIMVIEPERVSAQMTE